MRDQLTVRLHEVYKMLEEVKQMFKGLPTPTNNEELETILRMYQLIMHAQMEISQILNML